MAACFLWPTGNSSLKWSARLHEYFNNNLWLCYGPIQYQDWVDEAWWKLIDYHWIWDPHKGKRRFLHRGIGRLQCWLRACLYSPHLQCSSDNPETESLQFNLWRPRRGKRQSAEHQGLWIAVWAKYFWRSNLSVAKCHGPTDLGQRNIYVDIYRSQLEPSVEWRRKWWFNHWLLQIGVGCRL